MPTTTFSTISQDILRPMGLVTGTVSTNLSSGNASLIDDKLPRRFSVNDYFNNRWFAHITSQANDGQIRRIIPYTRSTKIATLNSALSVSASTSTIYDVGYIHSSFQINDIAIVYREKAVK